MGHCGVYIPVGISSAVHRPVVTDLGATPGTAWDGVVETYFGTLLALYCHGLSTPHRENSIRYLFAFLHLILL